MIINYYAISDGTTTDSTLAYDAFGNVINTSGNGDSHSHRFTGKPQDSTGLYYYGARFYDPTIGRFISLDPAMDGLNWYAYTHNNPLKYVDPDGNAAVGVTVEGCGAVGVGACFSVGAYLLVNSWRDGLMLSSVLPIGPSFALLPDFEYFLDNLVFTVDLGLTGGVQGGVGLSTKFTVSGASTKEDLSAGGSFIGGAFGFKNLGAEIGLSEGIPQSLSLVLGLNVPWASVALYAGANYNLEVFTLRELIDLLGEILVVPEELEKFLSFLEE